MENWFKPVVAVSGAAASYLFGGWSALLSILLTFVVLDYVSGVAAAAKEGRLRSDVGLWGIARKVAIFAVVAVAHLVDSALGDAHLFRDAAVFSIWPTSCSRSPKISVASARRSRRLSSGQLRFCAERGMSAMRIVIDAGHGSEPPGQPACKDSDGA